MQAYFPAAKPRTMSKRYAVDEGGRVYTQRRRYNPGPPYKRRYGRVYRKVYPYGARRSSNRVPRALIQQGVETKYYDTSVVGSTVPASGDWTGCELNPGTILCLNAPTQGTGASNRDGRKITMTSIEVTGTLYQAPQADQTAADTNPTVYLALVLDMQTNGGSATGLDSELVYTNPTNNAVCSTAPLRNMLYSKRYKVLSVWCENLSELVTTYDGNNMEQSGQTTKFKMFKRFGPKGLVTEFLGNAGTVADITDNGLFLIGCTTAANTAVQIYYNARLRFRG